MDKHEALQELKRIAFELGHTPSRNEFRSNSSITSHNILKLFGGYTQFLSAAGLEPAKPHRIDNSIFNRNITKHLDEYEPLPDVPAPVYTKFGAYPKIMSISDIHWPFCNRRLIAAFLDRVLELQPDYIFINGDAWDMYSHSKYPRSHNVFTPREEENLSRKFNEDFWVEVRKRAPKAKLIQMMGNHDIRPMKRIIESYPEAEDWVKERLAKMFTFEGVETIFDPRHEYIIGDIAIFHGYRGKLGDHRDYTHFNCINGHTHLGGTVFRKIRNTVLWELNSGLAGDPMSKGLTYTPQKITHWTPGWGEVDEFGPRFVPFAA